MEQLLGVAYVCVPRHFFFWGGDASPRPPVIAAHVNCIPRGKSDRFSETSILCTGSTFTMVLVSSKYC